MGRVLVISPPPFSPLGTMPRVIEGVVSGLTPPAILRGLLHESIRAMR